MIDSEPKLSRVKLSRRICEELKWRSRNGRAKEVSCRVALLKLQRRGAIRLPQAVGFPSRRKVMKVADSRMEAPVVGRLKEIQPVELIRIDSAESRESEVWKDLMDRHHYLGSGPLCGAQIRYLVRSQKHGLAGRVGVLGCGLASEARDAWIGWRPEAREQNFNQIVGNSRFLDSSVCGRTAFGIARVRIGLAATEIGLEAAVWLRAADGRNLCGGGTLPGYVLSCCKFCGSWERRKAVAGRTAKQQRFDD